MVRSVATGRSTGSAYLAFHRTTRCMTRARTPTTAATTQMLLPAVSPVAQPTWSVPRTPIPQAKTSRTSSTLRRLGCLRTRVPTGGIVAAGMLMAPSRGSPPAA